MTKVHDSNQTQAPASVKPPANFPDSPDNLASKPRDLPGIAEMCVCLNLRKAARIVTRRYDQAFAKVGLRATQTPVLLTLSINGSLTMTELANELGMEISTMSRNFGLLEARGLVTRMKRDGRTVQVSITAAGTEILAAALEGWDQVQDKTLAEIGPENWPIIAGALARLGESEERGSMTF